MKNKTYIAVILTFIFLTKSVVIDANGLNAFFGKRVISFVKPNCKKKSLAVKKKTTTSFLIAASAVYNGIELSSFCTPQFQIELFSWSTTILQPMAVFTDYFRTCLSYGYLENVSPPPRFV